MNPVRIFNRRLFVIDGSPNKLQDFREILCHVGGCIPDGWSEFGQDKLNETFLYHGKEALGLHCVDNGMSGCDLVKQAKAHGSPFAVTFPGIRADCDKS